MDVMDIFLLHYLLDFGCSSSWIERNFNLGKKKEKYIYIYLTSNEWT